MDKMEALGWRDYFDGKPITAFPDRSARDKMSVIAGRFADRARAAYEYGWRAAKDESKTPRSDFTLRMH